MCFFLHCRGRGRRPYRGVVKNRPALTLTLSSISCIGRRCLTYRTFFTERAWYARMRLLSISGKHIESQPTCRYLPRYSQHLSAEKAIPPHAAYQRPRMSLTSSPRSPAARPQQASQQPANSPSKGRSRRLGLITQSRGGRLSKKDFPFASRPPFRLIRE